MSANRTGGGRSLETDFRYFDQLPRAIKDVFWAAPMNIGCPSPMQVQSEGVAICRRNSIKVCAEFAARQNRKAYGKGHPCHDRLSAIAARFSAPSIARGA